ncbi:MAG: hypothetical protein U0939_22030 [Pirellulales bacterium]
MSTLFAEAAPTTAASQSLRTTMSAVRLSFTWFGVRRSLSAQQKATAAESFDAEGDFLSAAKKLLDTRHDSYKRVTAIRHLAVSTWKKNSLPFPEAGLRLVRRQDLAALDEEFRGLKSELSVAVEQLDAHYEDLKSSARRRLGRLYCPADYPATLRGLFDMSWDWPNVEPPSYLAQLQPELYAQECARVQARFEEALRLAEQAFFEELSQLVGHLTERLSGQDDGKPKVFRDSAVENLVEFFQRFRQLNIGSHEQLEELVEQAQRIVRGVAPQTLRDDAAFRQQVATQLAGVQAQLDGLLIDRPRRNILRKPR